MIKSLDFFKRIFPMDNFLFSSKSSFGSIFKRIQSLSNYKENKCKCRKCENIKNHVIDSQKEIKIKAYCFYCNKKSKMKIDFQYAWKSNNGEMIPNLRERLECEECGLNSRMRATFHFISCICDGLRNKDIYITEQLTPFFEILKKENENIIGSEFISEKNLGDLIEINGKNIRNEDLVKLTFSNNNFDLIISLDVLEHIPDYKKALGEVFRVLKNDGIFIFSVPFSLNSESNIVRAKFEKGEVINLLPPEIHGDPVTKNGCLCYYHFGWELLKDLKKIGFRDCNAFIYQSMDFGYLSEGIIFYSKK